MNTSDEICDFMQVTIGTNGDECSDLAIQEAKYLCKAFGFHFELIDTVKPEGQNAIYYTFTITYCLNNHFMASDYEKIVKTFMVHNDMSYIRSDIVRLPFDFDLDK